ncbi:MAG: ribose 5-phosphate isomerase B [Desulfobulbaceae bacterium]|nr:ribose 5-phosphate isomerase B [Desulfobulbaceae bacterium]
MKIALGSDHGGFELKEVLKTYLLQSNYDIIDVGCLTKESVDYPDFADKVVQQIGTDECQLGILICGTGIGMSIAANRKNYIRAANCYDEHTAKMSREHNNANVLCLGARVLGKEKALAIVDTWIGTEFSGGRHQRRIEKFSR